FHGSANAGVGPASAEVPAEPAFELVRRRVGMLIEESFGRDYESRRAEAALLTIVIDESLLQRMHFARFAQAFHCSDRTSLHIDGQQRTGINSLAVEQYCAGSAGPTIADALGAGQVKLVAQSVKQGDPGFKLRTKFLAITVSVTGTFPGPCSATSGSSRTSAEACVTRGTAAVTPEIFRKSRLETPEPGCDSSGWLGSF